MQQSPYTFTQHDLRIGNVVNYPLAEGEFIPATMDWEDLKMLEEEPEYFNDIHSPIPVTVEMVENVGYIADQHLEDVFIMPNSKGFVALRNGKWNYVIGNFICNIKIPFDYLHELQNLHYDFTREMLTLKSKEK